MDKAIWISLVGLVGWFALKGLGLGLWTWQTSISVGVLWHFTAMTALSLLNAKKELEHKTVLFLNRWKDGARSTARHTLIISCGMAFWYYGVAPGALEKHKFNQIQSVESALGTEDTFSDLQAQHPELLGRTRLEVLEMQINNIEVFYSPVFFIGLSLLLWLVVGFLTVALIDFIWQRIWRN